jgi:hypothetical protein
MNAAHRMLRLLTITERKEMTMARTPIHSGEILGDELEEIGISAKSSPMLSECREPPLSDSGEKAQHDGGHGLESQ